MINSWKQDRFRNAVLYTKKPQKLKLSFPVPFIPMELIPLEQTTIESYILVDKVSSGTYVENGDFLLAKITPSFENGKQGILKIDRNYAYATTEVIPFKNVQDYTDIDFIAFYLRQIEVRSDLAGKMEGSTGRQRLSKAILDNVLIWIPPLFEQRKIAYVLTTVQKVIEQQEKLIQVTTELKNTLMHRLFTEGVKGEPQKETEIGIVPESWEVIKLGAIANVSSGGTPSRNEKAYWENGTIPWVKTGEINYTTITDTGEKITEAGYKKSSTKLYLKGTLLMAMYGQGVTRGRVAMLGINATINQACAAIIPKDSSVLNSKFLYYFFEYTYDYIRELGHGANQKNLSATLVKSIEIAYPSTLGEQIEIVHVLERLDHKKEILRQKKEVLTDLFKTLLHELMTGQRRVVDIDFETADNREQPIMT